MLQLASTCEAMGIPKDTVKTLRRWDRVHMIKELAGVAVSGALAYLADAIVDPGMFLPPV